ncbi:hypothetical protein T4B_4395 [Trichinella pseudospiralis]|uniref:MULE transposase domain-containing protein n=2 Tax=Trichinella pseudospiralis TaxID=6337 RepID=A0A0V1K9N3_TRIPS|nr:hypothetical protein T4D_7677 [Trichinella pseudospiralis]KRZ33329.1 hypothetical protein T4B_4395 [Trichinella pseudospiralis]KRZ43920.1 hypothetical protein T4C_6452 [Trichinella pseudospiralis]
MDGTFKVIPEWYQQLFTIDVLAAGVNHIGTYGFILRTLIIKTAALKVDINPLTIICDFETAFLPVILVTI